MMARRSAFLALGGFNSSLRRGEDTEFNLRLAFQNGHFAGISAPLVKQTMTVGEEKSLSSEHSNMMLRVEAHRDYLEQSGWLEFCKRWVNLKFSFEQKKWWPTASNLVALICLYPYKSFLRFIWFLKLQSNRVYVQGT
jgi:hypothetical protein